MLPNWTERLITPRAAANLPAEFPLPPVPR